MKAYTQLNPQRIEHRFLKQFLPIFTEDIPEKVKNLYKYVPMELAMVTLLVTTITGTSIQRAAEKLSVDKENRGFHYFSKNLPAELMTFSHNFPHPNDIRQTLKEWDTRSIIARFRKYNRKLVRELKKSKLFRRLHGKYGRKGIAVALDITEVDYFGNENKYTVYTKGRSAAKLCHAYLTLQIVCPGFRLILDVEPVYRGDNLGKKIRRLLRRYKRQGLYLDPIYLDRGFHQINVLQTLRHDFDRLSIIPVIRSSRIKKAIVEWHKENGYKHGQIELTMGAGKNEVKYKLIFAPLTKEERQNWRSKPGANEDHIWNDFLYFCLPTLPDEMSEENSDASSIEQIFKEFSHMYRRRWGIETGNRVAKGIWGWTTSLSYELRIWLMFNAVTVYNMWVMENLVIIEKKGVPRTYNCACHGISVDQVEKLENEKKKTRKKKEQWIAPFEIRPEDPLRDLCDILYIIASRVVDRYYFLEEYFGNGYDPPMIVNYKIKAPVP